MTAGPNTPPEKAIWTDADFDVMGWHDAALHAVAIEPAPPHPGRLLLDLDYIIEWIAPVPPATTFSFWLCPATLVFERASDLVGDLSFVGRAFEPSLDAIVRAEPDEHGHRNWIVEGNEFTMRLRATGYTQYLRRRPVLAQRPWLTAVDRGGISFDERGFE